MKLTPYLVSKAPRFAQLRLARALGLRDKTDAERIAKACNAHFRTPACTWGHDGWSVCDGCRPRGGWS